MFGAPWPMARLTSSPSFAPHSKSPETPEAWLLLQQLDPAYGRRRPGSPRGAWHAFPPGSPPHSTSFSCPTPLLLLLHPPPSSSIGWDGWASCPSVAARGIFGSSSRRRRGDVDAVRMALAPGDLCCWRRPSPHPGVGLFQRGCKPPFLPSQLRQFRPHIAARGRRGLRGTIGQGRTRATSAVAGRRGGGCSALEVKLQQALPLGRARLLDRPPGSSTRPLAFDRIDTNPGLPTRSPFHPTPTTGTT